MRRAWNWRAVASAHGPILLVLLCCGLLYTRTLGAYGMLGWDESEYASLGRSVARGQGFTISGRPNSLRPPVVPLAAAASILLCGRSSDAVVKLPSVAFSLLALWIIFWCAAVVYDGTTGLLAACFLALSPWFWTATPNVLSEIPFLAFFCCAVVCFYLGLYRAVRYFGWSWLAWGLAVLTRYTAVLFAPVAVGMLVAALLSGGRAVRARIFSAGFLLSPLAGAVLVAPWLVRQQLAFGDALIGFEQASRQLQVYMPDVSMPWSYYPARMPAMVSPAILLAVLVGIAWVLWRRDRFGVHCLGVAAGLVLWFSCYRYKEARLVSSALPFLCILAARGVTALVVERLTPRTPVVLLVVLGVFTASFIQTRGTFAKVVSLGYPSFLDAMRYLRTHSNPEARVVGANYPQIFWYADRSVDDFPHPAELPGLLERAEWVIVTNFERGQRPYVRDLVKRLTRADMRAGNVMAFRDSRFGTLVIRSATLRGTL